MVLVFLILALAISVFNIWRRVRKKLRNEY